MAKAKEVAAPQAAVVQNDVTRPKEGTASAKIWTVADKLQAKNALTRAAVIAGCESFDCSDATVATQFQRWRVFNGLASERSGNAVPKATKKPVAKKPAAKKSAPKAPAKAPKAPVAATV